MTKAGTVSLWAPRIAGIAMAGFLAIFALDGFGGKPFLSGLPEFLVHLAPAAVVAGALALAWRVPMLGAAAFAALAAGYAVMVNGRLDWSLAISGPLAAVAALFLISGLRRVA